MRRLLKVVAGGDVEGGDGEKTNAHRQQNRIKHIDLLRVPGRVSTPPGSPIQQQRELLSLAARAGQRSSDRSKKITRDAYKIERGQQGAEYKGRIRAGSSRACAGAAELPIASIGEIVKVTVFCSRNSQRPTFSRRFEDHPIVLDCCRIRGDGVFRACAREALQRCVVRRRKN